MILIIEVNGFMLEIYDCMLVILLRFLWDEWLDFLYLDVMCLKELLVFLFDLFFEVYFVDFKVGNLCNNSLEFIILMLYG